MEQFVRGHLSCREEVKRKSCSFFEGGGHVAKGTALLSYPPPGIELGLESSPGIDSVLTSHVKSHVSLEGCCITGFRMSL